MTTDLNNGFNELNLDELEAINAGGVFEIFMRGAEILFVATTTAIGAAATGGSLLGAAGGALAGEVAWEYMFGDSLAGNLLH